MLARADRRYFDLMERVAEALRYAGLDENEIRRQYAQALIDQRRIPAALDTLDLLMARRRPPGR